MDRIRVRKPDRCKPVDHLPHSDLTEKIIGCAYTVHGKLGHGFLESVYEKAMLLELQKTGLRVESQKSVAVYYDEQVVGEFVADILVEDCIVVELKAIREVREVHEVQLVNYLKATGRPVGLLLNFGRRRVEVKRKVRELP